jgi:hypothetical protein
MADTSERWLYCVESDPDVVAAAARPFQILVFGLVAAFVVLACFAWWADMPRDSGPSPLIPAGLAVGGLLLAALVSLAMGNCIMKNDVYIGADFVAASLSGPSRSPRGFVFTRYTDIVRVSLDVSKGRIAGVTIRGKGLNVVPARWVNDPAVVVRAIFEQAPPDVMWRRSRRPFAKLSREEVGAMIEKTRLPDINALLPPSAAYVRADDMFGPKGGQPTGLLARLFVKGPTRSVNVITLQTMTPVSCYVDLMLLQMFEAGPAVQVMKSSEPLPVMTFGEHTAEPQPFEDVVHYLAMKCGLDPRNASGWMKGTFDLTIQKVPCKVLCRFDNSLDLRCEIRLEKIEPNTR